MNVPWKYFLLWAFLYLTQALDLCPFPALIQNCIAGTSIPCCPQQFPYSVMQRRWSPATDELISQVARGYLVPAAIPFQIASQFQIDGLAVGLHVYKIFDIDEKARHFKMKYTLRMVWRDCRTVHNCTYLQIDDMHPEFSSFWIPRFARTEVTRNEPTMTATRISIDPDGLVEYMSDHVSTLGCDFKFSDFPYDKQDCTITLYTPLAPWLLIDWDPSFGKGGVVYKPNSQGEWDISEFRTEEVTLEGSAYNGTSINAVRAHVVFSRIAGVQVRSYVIPTMCFWFSSWCGLFIDCTAVPARAALGVVPLLILANKMSALTASLPPMTGTCVLERYMLYNMGLMALHLFEFALVNFSMRLQRELKDARRDEEAAADAVPHGISQKVSQWRDSMAVRYLSTNLNMHTRWMSLLLFTVINIVASLGY